jgi:hypothetical protein
MPDHKQMKERHEYIIRWNCIDYIVGIRDLSTQLSHKIGQRCREDRKPIKLKSDL